VSEYGGLVESSCGVSVDSVRAPRGGIDTLVAVGGYTPAEGEPPVGAIKLLLNLSKRARRVTSVCTGAFLLGEAGLLNGKKVTTHWKYAAALQARFPRCRVDVDRIYVQDENTWTSAGSTAGIDLALALIEDDLGLDVSHQVARGLVVFQRRLGGQSQYSALLELESGSDRIRQVLTYIRANIPERLSIPLLAEVARLSVRQFSRAFLSETGLSPAKAIERIRAEVAKPQIEDSRKPLDEIARVTGFASTERMRQAFVRSFGRPPQAFRRETRLTRKHS
jgi:transcriptional regulator GlxA family with amidase domain